MYEVLNEHAVIHIRKNYMLNIGFSVEEEVKHVECNRVRQCLYMTDDDLKGQLTLSVGRLGH